MTETTFPVNERPLSQDQWRDVTLGIGSGVLNEVGIPYRLSNISNAANTVRVNTATGRDDASAIVAGFYHRITSAVTLSVPAVTRATTYTIALQYDPTRLTKPVELGVFTTLDHSQGRQYLILHTIARQPNQLLTDADIRSFSPRIAPTIQVPSRAELPDAATVLRGTVAFLHGGERDIVLARDTGGSVQWVSLLSGVQSEMEAARPYRVSSLSMAGWNTSSATGGFVVTPMKNGGMHVSGAFELRRSGSASSFTQGTSWINYGRILPHALREARVETLRVTGSVRFAPAWLELDVAEGLLRARTLVGSQDLITNSPVNFALEWVI